MTDTYVNTTEAAKHAGVSARTIQRWSAAGLLPQFTRPGNVPRTFYRIADLDSITTPQNTPTNPNPNQC